MRSNDPCPRCKEEVILVDPTDEEWSLDANDFTEEAEVWLCVACGWNEEADDEDAMAEHDANLDWLAERLGVGEQP